MTNEQEQAVRELRESKLVPFPAMALIEALVKEVSQTQSALEQANAVQEKAHIVFIALAEKFERLSKTLVQWRQNWNANQMFSTNDINREIDDVKCFESIAREAIKITKTNE